MSKINYKVIDKTTELEYDDNFVIDADGCVTLTAYNIKLLPHEVEVYASVDGCWHRIGNVCLMDVKDLREWIEIFEARGMNVNDMSIGQFVDAIMGEM